LRSIAPLHFLTISDTRLPSFFCTLQNPGTLRIHFSRCPDCNLCGKDYLLLSKLFEDLGLAAMSASLAPECNEVKERYDTCFLKWYSEKYLRGAGNSNKNECESLFNDYQKCLGVSWLQSGVKGSG
ncbi:uncharacterized protein PgNI_08375, partial [Pyricularia grisea]|uniref:Uncharacterized protein n=1 Tax=Pyricularia grisea TaxID=148305 RepID=A0A6P8AWN6_PYRGI